MTRKFCFNLFGSGLCIHIHAGTHRHHGRLRAGSQGTFRGCACVHLQTDPSPCLFSLADLAKEHCKDALPWKTSETLHHKMTETRYGGSIYRTFGMKFVGTKAGLLKNGHPWTHAGAWLWWGCILVSFLSSRRWASPDFSRLRLRPPAPQWRRMPAFHKHHTHEFETNKWILQNTIH